MEKLSENYMENVRRMDQLLGVGRRVEVVDRE